MRKRWRDTLNNLKSILLILACVGYFPTQADCASSRAVMQVSAITVPSTHAVTVIIADEHDDEGSSHDEAKDSHDPTRYLSASASGDQSSGQQKKVIQSILEQLSLPDTTPFLLSFEGEFADTFHLLVQGDTIRVINGPLHDGEAMPEGAVMTLLLRY